MKGMNDLVLFCVTYGVLWVALAWYMITLSKKQRMLREEIRMLKHRARIQE
jgi:CcmD family protein